MSHIQNIFNILLNYLPLQVKGTYAISLGLIKIKPKIFADYVLKVADKFN